MTLATQRLPDRQLQTLEDAYGRARAHARLTLLSGLLVLAMCLGLAAVATDIRPGVFASRLGTFTSYFDRILMLDSGERAWRDPVEWFWGLKKWLRLLGDTLVIAYVGTILGSLGGFLVCFVASANLSSKWACWVARRFLEVLRTVPEIVFALVFVIAFGLGPLPGVLALAIHTMGALGKQYADVVENIDKRPVEGLRAAGANWVETVRYGALPQVLSNFISYTLLRFEINVRGASVMGFVGAGGIGQELLLSIRKFYYSDVSAILILIILTVFAIDMITARLRNMFISQREGER